MAGFRAIGMFPFNRRAISIPGTEERTATLTAKPAYQLSIKYLPFYSPHHRKLSITKGNAYYPYYLCYLRILVTIVTHVALLSLLPLILMFLVKCIIIASSWKATNHHKPTRTLLEKFYSKRNKFKGKLQCPVDVS